MQDFLNSLLGIGALLFACLFYLAWLLVPISLVLVFVSLIGYLSTDDDHRGAQWEWFGFFNMMVCTVALGIILIFLNTAGFLFGWRDSAPRQYPDNMIYVVMGLMLVTLAYSIRRRLRHQSTYFLLLGFLLPPLAFLFLAFLL